MTISSFVIEMEEGNTCEFCFAEIQPMPEMMVRNYTKCSKARSPVDECKGNLLDRPVRCPLAHIELD